LWKAEKFKYIGDKLGLLLRSNFSYLSTVQMFNTHKWMYFKRLCRRGS